MTSFVVKKVKPDGFVYILLQETIGPLDHQSPTELRCFQTPSKLHSSITGTPTFKPSLLGGTPGKLLFVKQILKKTPYIKT